MMTQLDDSTRGGGRGFSQPLVTLAMLLLLLLAAGHAPAMQVEETSPPNIETRNPATLKQRFYTSYEAGDFAAAAAYIEAYLEQQPHDPTMLYNLACTQSLLGKRDRAAGTLHKAVEAGFNDIDFMQADPDLKSIRDHRLFKAIVAGGRAYAKRHHRIKAVDRFRNQFGEEEYRYESDEELNLDFATALDPIAHEEMKQMLRKQAAHLCSTLFPGMQEYDVLIAVPQPEHANELLKGDPSIGGLYDHGQLILVTRDIGASLRHEFFHLVHYGHMEALGQDHPLWLQEGLASLYEDYEFKGGRITFLANSRHNIIKRRVEANRAMPWEQLFKLSEKQFMSRAGALYPQVRSMFEYVADRGKLAPWYDHFVRHFRTDPTGVDAFEATFDKSLEEVEADWKRWVRSRPYVDNYIDVGDASMGIVSRMHSGNDGVQVDEILPGSAASRSLLEVGDVIVAIDGRPIRSTLELQQHIGQKSVGDVIRVRFRRDGNYMDIGLKLAPRQH